MNEEAHYPRRTTRTKVCCQGRKMNSKGAVLMIVWTILVFASAINPAYLNVFLFTVTLDHITWAPIVGLSTVVLIGPIAGLLASIHFGRYNAIRTSLWLMWGGSAITLPFYIMEWFFPDTQQTLSNSVLVITNIASGVGFALFIVNAVPFGLDQMPDASGEQISAFIFWHAWSILACIVTISILGSAVTLCNYLNNLGIALLLSLLAVTLLTVTLCSSFLLRGWLIIEPKGINPLKTFCGVLGFAAKHKIPVRRSAFTFWEEVKPSRLDLAKKKYGGPFTHEEVEDIKTCFRMTVVLASISVSMTAFYSHDHLLSIYNVLEAEFISNFTTCNAHILLVSAGNLVVVLGFPMFDVFICPLIKMRWIASTLRRVGFSQILSLTASLLLLVSTTVWYMYTNPTTCMFTCCETSSPFQVDSNWIEIPYNMLTFVFICLTHTATLEFVCAQAPYVLRGLLVGFMYSVLLFNFALGTGVYFAWKLSYREKAPNSPSCGVWFYLYTTITATLGCVLWCAVAKWYKRRERDEPDMCRIFAENYYDH